MLRSLKVSEGRRHVSRSVVLAIPLAMAIFVSLEGSAAAQMPPNSPPVIDEFSIIETMPNFYIFSGHVYDPGESAEGYVVRFGGLVDGRNMSATVQADGSFSEAFYLPGISSGVVTADTTDPHGAAAETKMFYLSPY